MSKLAEYAKFIAALLGAIAASFSTLIPAEWTPWLTSGIAFLTAVAVILVPNKQPVTETVEEIYTIK